MITPSPMQLELDFSEPQPTTWCDAITNYQQQKFDGIVPVSLSLEPVRYHIVCATPMDVTDAQIFQLAQLSCKTACFTADVVRSKLVPHHMPTFMSQPCMEKLRNLALLLQAHTYENPQLRQELGNHYPVLPHWLHGMMVSPTVLDIAVRLSVGACTYLATLVFKQWHNRWVCVAADIG